MSIHSCLRNSVRNTRCLLDGYRLWLGAFFAEVSAGARFSSRFAAG